MKSFRIDCTNIESYADFIDAFNQGMIKSFGGKWNGNLDAFNDYLSWPEQIPYEIVVIGVSRCEEILSYKLNSTHLNKLWPTIKEILDENQKSVKVTYA